jgi:TetR/AcrR family transcriptional repressor of nem operon
MGRTSDAHERLVKVAFDLIWQQNYASVSVDNICEQAGVKKGSFYHFFESKSELALAACEKHWEKMKGHYDVLFAAEVPPLERIENYCNFMFEKQSERFRETGRVLGCPFASLGAELSGQDEEIRKKTQNMFERACKYVETALTDAHRDGLIDAGDFKAKAHAVGCLVTGILIRAKISNNPDELLLLRPSIMDMIGARTIA